MSKVETTSESNEVRDKIAEQAFSWLLKMEAPNVQPEVHAAFSEWLKESPVHVEEYLLITATWHELDNVDPDRDIRIDDLLSDKTKNVVAIPAGKATPPARGCNPAALRLNHTLPRNAAIFLLFLAASFFLYQHFLPGTDSYKTDRGEQTSFTLDDGSIVYLNTQTHIKVRLTERLRTIELLSGEALFQVAHDPERPFRVLSEDTVVEALGTQFNVLQRGEQTTVTVVEGKISISAPNKTITNTNTATPGTSHNNKLFILRQGEEMAVARTGEVIKQEKVNTEETIAWRARRLVFRNNSLEDIARQFNRYNKLQLIIEGEGVAKRKLTGVFSADDPASLADFLNTDSTIHISQHHNQIIIRDKID